MKVEGIIKYNGIKKRFSIGGIDLDIKQLLKRFTEIYGGDEKDVRKFFAPGRVNLIGEHTDYNKGFVFPCALSFGTFAAARKRKDNVIKFASTNFDLQVTVSSDDIYYAKEDDWANYPKGVIKEFKNMGFEIGGFEVLYDGNIPNGAGLSSSASIELATSVLLKGLFDCNIDMVDMVKLSQKAENKFIGVNCGIMDQFSIGMGKKDNAILLNCKTLDYDYVPVVLDGYKIVIANTNKRRGLQDSKYNERRSQCEEAVSCLKKELDIEYLADIDSKTFEDYKYLIDDEVVLKRATHVVYEIKRTLDAAEKLKCGDLEAFGKLMNESHESLKDLYEVTGIELDTLVDEAQKIKGVVGSRMTGAGFGGCSVSIVKEDAIDEFIKTVGENYNKKTGLCADFYIAEIGDGAKEI